MRFFVVFAILICAAFPAFSQSGMGHVPAAERSTVLSETMGRSISAASSILEDFDAQIGENGDMSVYISYLKKYQFLVSELEESEVLLNRYIRSSERTTIIKAERDNYESLLKQLQTIKSEFDSSSRSTR